MKLKKVKNSNLRVVKTAGFKLDKKAENVNRRAGLSKTKKTKEGENLVNRRKPLALKHVRRMRKAALALSCVFVGIIAYIGVGFFTKSPIEELPEVDYATVCAQAPASGSAVDYTLVENVAFMNYVLQNQPYWSSEMHSTVYTVMQQKVHTYKQYYNGVLISADIAEGVSSEATQFCVANDVILWRSAANKKFNGMDTAWSTKAPEGLTLQKFKTLRGLPPSEFSVYVLNENTIKNANDYSVKDNGNGTYTMTLDLNVNTAEDINAADYYYKQQMYVTGGLDERPEINSTTLTYTFDSSWRILEFTINDSYTAKMGIKVPCTSTTTTVFSYDEDKAANTYYEDYFKQYVNNFTEAEPNDTNEPSALNYLAAAFGSVLSEGATFKVNVGLDKLDLDGVVHVGLEDGALSDIHVALGEISVFMGTDNILYVSDGTAKYKLDISAFSTASAASEKEESEESEESSPLDLGALMDQLTAGTFEVSDTGAKLDTVLEILGLEINLHFTFEIADNEISLGFVSAEIPVGNTELKARLSFGTKDDIPAKPRDISGYTDILNEGITLKTAVSIDNLILNGFVKIIMTEGAFAGVYADLGDITVLYDCPSDMLYLTDGNVKYKLGLNGLSGDGLNLSGISLDTGLLLSQIINNLHAENGSVSTSTTLNILEQTISAALAVKLTGGISVGADISAWGHNVKLNVSLTAEEVVLPDFDGYTDILNEGVTLGVDLAVDNFKLNGLVYIGLSEGQLTDVRADFGDIKVYYVNGAIYLTDGNVRYKVALPESDNSFDLSGIDIDIKDIIDNITFADGKISTGIQLNALGETLGAMLEIGLSGGINVGANATAFGKTVVLKAVLSSEDVILPDFDGYTDILNEGVTLGVDLAVDNFKLSGLVYIGLSEGQLTDVRADFGNIAVYYVNDALYLTDGNVRYKVALPKSDNSFDLSGFDIDIKDIIDNITFADGKISTGIQLNALGETLGAMLEIGLSGGISVGANATAFGKTVVLKAVLSSEEVILPDLEGYVDILNEGVTLGVDVAVDNFKLNGLVYIGLSEGQLTEVRADFGNIAVYYVNGAIYLTDGNVRYKFALPESDSAFDLSGIDIDIKDIINNITFADGKISTSIQLNALGETLGAMLEIGLSGGINVGANATAFGKTVVLKAVLSSEEVILPDLDGYTDILNNGIAFDLNMAIDETGNLGDGAIELSGRVFIGLSEGKLTEVRADFGDIAVYFETAGQVLYVKVGTAKFKINIGNIQSGATLDLASVLPDGASKMLGELLNNIVAELNEISIRTDIGFMDALVPVSAKLNLANGLSAELDVELAGVRAYLSVKPTEEEVPALDGKQDYTDVINDIWGAVESVIGNSIAAEVSGSLYSYDNSKYAQYGYIKYNFNAMLEYDYNGENIPVNINAGKVNENGVREGVAFSVDSEVYLHFNLNLVATSPLDDSLCLDILVMDADPATNANGVTGGGYTKDGVLDVYVCVSTYSPYSSGYDPLKVYAPMDEIMTLLAMVGSAANLDKLSFEDNDALNGAVLEIAGIIDSLLIEKYIPETKDQFSSLGASLIPQILGTSLQEYIEQILSSLASAVDEKEETPEIPEAPERKFLISDEYVKAISVGNDSLTIKLNSALIYNTEMTEDDFLVVEFNKAQFEDGSQRLTGISLKNIYFGENNVNELDIALSLKYGGIQRPDAESGLNGYLNFDGIDTLLEALINSATHATESGDAQYDLNHYYLLNGSVNATIKVIGINVGVDIDLNSIAVYIGEDNDVSVDAHISYQGVQELNQIAINGDTDLYLSIRNDMIYLKRVQKTYWETIAGVWTTEKTYATPVVEYRVMPLSAFLDDIMNQIIFIFNFGSLVSSNLDGVGSGGGSGGSGFDNRDLGNLVKYVLAYYTCTESDGEVNWNFAINGQMLTDLVGMTMSDIPLTFTAAKNADGTLTVKGLTVQKSTMKLLGSAVSLNFSANLNYCNPNEIEDHGYTDSSLKLDEAPVSELNGLTWNEVLGGNSFKDICKVINWNLLTVDTGVKYLSFANDSPLGVAPLKYIYATNGDNTEFAQWGGTFNALYNGKTNNIYTYSVAPALNTLMPKVENKTAVWKSGYEVEDGTLVLRAIYDTTYKVTVDSVYPTNDDYSYDCDAEIWNNTIEEAYGKVLLPVNVYYTDGENNTYGLKYYVDGSGNICEFENTAYNSYGELCFIAEVNSEASYTAVWERVYKVNFIAEFDGTSHILSKFYYENENVADNLPEVPVVGGYAGEWVIPENTIITPDSNYTFYAKYTILSYNIKVVSAQAVTDDKFVSAEGGYGYEQNYLYASKVTLSDLTPVSGVYSFKGFYSNPEFTGEPVTEFLVTGNATYYAKWEGKTLNVTYKSDVQFGNAKLGEDNFYSFTVSMQYGASDNLASYSIDGLVFLGWFEENNGAYGYVSTADVLKASYESLVAASESVDITLWAVWAVDDIQIDLTKVTGTTWSYTGTYAMSYADGISSEIAKSAGVQCTVSVTYYAHGNKIKIFGKGGEAFEYDEIGTATFSGTSGSLDKSGMTCGNGVGGSNLKGSVTLSATFSCGGEELGSTSQFEKFRDKS